MTDLTITHIDGFDDKRAYAEQEEIFVSEN